MDKKTEIFAGYFPVIHDGYIRAINRHPDIEIGVLDNDLIQPIDYLRKDIRALSPELAKQCLEGLGRTTRLIGKAALEIILNEKTVIMPDDDVTREIIKQYPEATTSIIKEPIFLRWDRDNSAEASNISPDREIDMNSDDPLIKLIQRESSESTNWFRHIGSAIFDDKAILISGHNSSMPTEYTSWIEGDPRITAKKGEAIERSIDIHAEAGIISLAAKNGIELEGKSICVSTFPCPNCAKLIALSGIKKCYFIEGYAMLDGQSILKNHDIEIIKINTDVEAEDPLSLKTYPKK